MSKNLQNTDYHGAVITPEMADALKKTPVGKELFRFEKRGGKTILQAKLPEKGRYKAQGEKDKAIDGQEYDIRVNMNYLVRGMARYCLDKDGNLDLNKADELMELCYDLNNQPRGSGKQYYEKLDSLIKKLDIPEGRKGEFEVFLNANGVPPLYGTGPLLKMSAGPIPMMYEELTGPLSRYQSALKGECGEAAQEYAKKYMSQYENILRGYQEMANMDPEKETRILYPMDCGSFAEQTDAFVQQNNNYREANKLPLLNVERKGIVMTDQEEKDDQLRAFDNHWYVTTDVALELPNEKGLLEPKNYTISLENTAPGVGDLLHRPEIERTGIGIYRNKQEVEAYHRSQNLKTVPKKDMDTFMDIRKHGVPYVNKQYTVKLQMPQERNFTRYYQLHTGKYVTGLPDKKLAEYTAKAASAIMHAYDHKGVAFDVDVPRSEAKSMQSSPAFKAVIRAAGNDKLRSILKKGDTMELVKLIKGGEKRYALSEQAKEKLNQLGEKMNMNRKKPDRTWDDLHTALTKDNMKDSEGVFRTVESFVKGKKSLKNDPVRQESVDLALDALAIVAAEGDEVTKARAQILVDRFNTVRGAKKPGDPGFVDLDQRLENMADKQPAIEEGLAL